MSHSIQEFDTAGELNLALGRHIHAGLRRIVTRGRQASLAVSGGSTPAALFSRLANIDLAWDRVRITLADERCVVPDSPASNEFLVRRRLLQEKAAAAQFLPISNGPETDRSWLNGCRQRLIDQQIIPFDVLILGMGEDGHTASLFPDADNIDWLMSPDNQDVLAMTRAPSAAHQRVTFTLETLLKSRQILLHITGDTKKDALQKALDGNDTRAMPIRALLHHPSLDMAIYWAP